MARSSISNAEIADRLLELGQLLGNEGENRFKVKAYRNAAVAVRRYPRKAADIAARGEALTQIPGVGKGIASAITELLSSGSLARAEELNARLPPGAAEISRVAGISIRDATRVVHVLGVSSMAQLRRKMSSKRTMETLGVRLTQALRQTASQDPRVLWTQASEAVESFLKYLEAAPGVARVQPAGSYRRRMETVGTLRFVVMTARPRAAYSALRAHAGLEHVADKKDVITARFSHGPRVVIRVAPDDEWGDAVVEETGSAAHLKEVDLHVGSASFPPADSEEAWYEKRGLPFIEPELREGRGEVAAAGAEDLPKLLAVDDIRGDLHAHTTASDGVNTLEEMVRAARAKGYEYLAITDHSKSLKIAHGLDERRLATQIAAIDRMNRRSKSFRVLKGSEVDILEDGTLDFSDEILAQLDVVICSVHSRFILGKHEQTKRILRAIENPYVTCVGHLTGRKLLRRPGYEVDTEAVLAAVKRNGKMLEINSNPLRLDVDDKVAQRARQMGVPLLINTDAHSVRELDFMALGVQQARRGWQGPDTVANTLSAPRLLALLRRMREASSRNPASRRRKA